MLFLLFIITVSGLWRVSNLIANEDGFLGVFIRARKLAFWLESKFDFFALVGVYEILQCEWCNSVWLGVFFTLAWLKWGTIMFILLLPFALSAWVLFIKMAMDTIQLYQQTLKRYNATMGDKTEEEEPFVTTSIDLWKIMKS